MTGFKAFDCRCLVSRKHEVHLGALMSRGPRPSLRPGPLRLARAPRCHVGLIRPGAAPAQDPQLSSQLREPTCQIREAQRETLSLAQGHTAVKARVSTGSQGEGFTLPSAAGDPWSGGSHVSWAERPWLTLGFRWRVCVGPSLLWLSVSVSHLASFLFLFTFRSFPLRPSCVSYHVFVSSCLPRFRLPLSLPSLPSPAA